MLSHERISNGGGTPLQSKSYKCDSFTRPIEMLTTIGGSFCTERSTYNHVGKLIASQRRLHTAKNFQQVVSVDARCNVLARSAGTHKEQRTYRPATDSLLTITATLANSSSNLFLELISIEVDGLFVG